MTNTPFSPAALSTLEKLSSPHFAGDGFPMDSNNMDVLALSDANQSPRQ